MPSLSGHTLRITHLRTPKHLECPIRATSSFCQTLLSQKLPAGPRGTAPAAASRKASADGRRYSREERVKRPAQLPGFAASGAACQYMLVAVSQYNHACTCKYAHFKRQILTFKVLFLATGQRLLAAASCHLASARRSPYSSGAV